MTVADLKGVADEVVRRAERQGYVVGREVREELIRVGASSDLWKDVVALARPSLSFRSGRYYYRAPVSERVRQEQTQQQGVHQAIDHLLHDRPSGEVALGERRGQDRVDFVQTVTVRTEDGEEFSLLSRDLSPTGIRLVGARRLLGHKVHVLIPGAGDEPPYDFLVRILWTCAVGEDQFENGGSFLQVNHESHE